MSSEPLLTPAQALAAVRHRIVDRFAEEHPEAAELIALRLPAVQGKALAGEYPGRAPVIRGLVLYARLLRDLLRELGRERPDWRHAFHIQRWIKQLEAAAAAGSERRG